MCGRRLRACTVVLGELAADGRTVDYRAVNSLYPVPATIDGKELVTVESLQDADGELHPVQRAMVQCHGSQCGFCTPGFVMLLLPCISTWSEERGLPTPRPSAKT